MVASMNPAFSSSVIRSNQLHASRSMRAFRRSSSDKRVQLVRQFLNRLGPRRPRQLADIHRLGVGLDLLRRHLGIPGNPVARQSDQPNRADRDSAEKHRSPTLTQHGASLPPRLWIRHEKLTLAPSGSKPNTGLDTRTQCVPGTAPVAYKPSCTLRGDSRRSPHTPVALYVGKQWKMTKSQDPGFSGISPRSTVPEDGSDGMLTEASARACTFAGPGCGWRFDNCDREPVFARRNSLHRKCSVGVLLQSKIPHFGEYCLHLRKRLPGGQSLQVCQILRWLRHLSLQRCLNFPGRFTFYSLWPTQASCNTVA